MQQQTVATTTSLEEQDPHRQGSHLPPKKKKSRRPPSMQFLRMGASAFFTGLTIYLFVRRQLFSTAAAESMATVLPMFFAIGIMFAPIGGLLIWAHTRVQNIIIDYSGCATDAPIYPEFSALSESHVESSFSSGEISKAMWSRRTNINVTFATGATGMTTRCTLRFTVPNDMGPPVYLYYRLTNFYQNHRRYVKSLDLEQLKGQALSNATIKGSPCDPLRIDPHTKKAYYPCGLIANSLFNDTIHEPRRLGETHNVTYPMTKKGISWQSDRKIYKKSEYRWDQVSPPPNWALQYPHGYTEQMPPPNLEEHEDFQAWMRTAGLPTFSKLSRRNEDSPTKAGTYEIDVDHFFPVTIFDGTKSLFFTTRTIMGGKNAFLGIAYIIVGGACFTFGMAFLLAYLIKPRRIGDPNYLSWNQAIHRPLVPAVTPVSSHGT